MDFILLKGLKNCISKDGEMGDSSLRVFFSSNRECTRDDFYIKVLYVPSWLRESAKNHFYRWPRQCGKLDWKTALDFGWKNNKLGLFFIHGLKLFQIRMLPPRLADSLRYKSFAKLFSRESFLLKAYLSYIFLTGVWK